VIDPTGGASTAGQTDPTTIYDGGTARAIISTVVSPGVSGALVGATAGLKTKLLGIHVVCSAFTSAGTMYLTNGSGGGFILWLSQLQALGNVAMPPTGFVLCQTGVNTALWFNFGGGAASFGVNIVYYQAP
jgi:hypothetical protein